MHKSPLVSVIIAFLNEEKFLAEAIESVLNQSHEHWELLLIDDGSSDNSVSIAKKYAASLPKKIYYFDHEDHTNQGLSASRNAGIKRAKGQLVAFLDADDFWLPEKLSAQVSIFQKHPDIAMVAEASEYWFDWNNKAASNVKIPVGAPPDKVYLPTELTQYLYPLSSGAAPCPSGLMLTQNALIRAGGFEESYRGKLQLYEDQAFLHKIYLKEKVFVSSLCNNKYRQRAGSIVYQVHSDGHYHTVRQHFLEHLQNYLQRENITDEKTSRLIKKALLPYQFPKLHFLTEILPEKIKNFLTRGFKKIKRLQWQTSPY